MFILLNFIFLFLGLFSSSVLPPVGYIEKNIKYFGAKGDGKTNDQAAFEKAAAFFNKRGGNGKLIIPKGTFIVGRQVFGKGVKGKAAYAGVDVLRFVKVQNFEIRGLKGSELKFADALKYGAFDPVSGQAFKHTQKRFINYSYVAFIGHCIYFQDSRDVKISGIEIDGNSESFQLGGTYGDIGRQLPHYGVFLKNCREFVVESVNVHHTALDGITIANAFNDGKSDELEINNSRFEYNGRQGFSWVGGNGLRVKKSSFNYTGRSEIFSPPGAGLDIEAEVGPIRNGYFEDCEFIDNRGCGLVADSGNSADCTFVNCTFWGLTTWSVWVNKPGFTFRKCNIYGSFVHGFDAPDTRSATKFIQCTFEDKPYKNQEAYGKFLLVTNRKKRVNFEQCTFIANKKKLCWVEGLRAWQPDEQYQFSNCNFFVKSADYPKKDWVALIRCIRYKNCTFTFEHPNAKAQQYWINDCCGPTNTDLGGNKIVYTATKG